MLSKAWISSIPRVTDNYWLPLDENIGKVTPICSSGFSKFMTRKLTSFVTLSNTSPSYRTGISGSGSTEVSESDAPLKCIQEKNMVVTRKVRIYPPAKMIELFKLCVKATQFYWEKVVDNYVSLTKSIDRKNVKVIRGDKDFWKKLRSDAITHNKNLEGVEAEFIRVPYFVRDDVFRTFRSSIKSLITAGLRFVEFKKKTSGVFGVRGTSINTELRLIFTRSQLGPFKLRKKTQKWWDENIKGKILRDCQISTENDSYYLLLVLDDKMKTFTGRKNIISLDPGMKTFQTFYTIDGSLESNQGSVGKFGDNFWASNQKIFKKIEVLNKLKNNERRQWKKKRYRKKRMKLYAKITSRVDNLHWQTASYICKNYDNVLLPKFDTKNMLEGDVLPGIVKKNLLHLAHSRFKNRLIHLGKKYGTNVKIVTEEYTTKTCGRCATQVLVGKARTFECTKCNLVIDRDYNAARNIMIKNAFNPIEDFLENLNAFKVSIAKMIAIYTEMLGLSRV